MLLLMKIEKKELKPGNVVKFKGSDNYDIILDTVEHLAFDTTLLKVYHYYYGYQEIEELYCNWNLVVGERKADRGEK